jgi:hypothetical protein
MKDTPFKTKGCPDVHDVQIFFECLGIFSSMLVTAQQQMQQHNKEPVSAAEPTAIPSPAQQHKHERSLHARVIRCTLDNTGSLALRWDASLHHVCLQRCTKQGAVGQTLTPSTWHMPGYC